MADFVRLRPNLQVARQGRNSVRNCRRVPASKTHTVDRTSFPRAPQTNQGASSRKFLSRHDKHVAISSGGVRGRQLPTSIANERTCAKRRSRQSDAGFPEHCRWRGRRGDRTAPTEWSQRAALSPSRLRCREGHSRCRCTRTSLTDNRRDGTKEAGRRAHSPNRSWLTGAGSARPMARRRGPGAARELKRDVPPGNSTPNLARLSRVEL